MSDGRYNTKNILCQAFCLKTYSFFVLGYKKEIFYGFIAQYSNKNRTLLTFLVFCANIPWV